VKDEGAKHHLAARVIGAFLFERRARSAEPPAAPGVVRSFCEPCWSPMLFTRRCRVPVCDG
jgi:hypothetical protein